MTASPLTRLGLQLAGFTFPGVPDSGIFDATVEMAQAAEQSGFDSLWTMDHLVQIDTVGSRDEPILEAYTTLAGLAVATRTARLGVLVTASGFRNPALLAKMVTTIDVMSHGRAVLGIGAGWFEDEFDAYGFPFPPARERLRQLADTVRICRAMFAAEHTASAGVTQRVTDAWNVPAPTNPSGPPVLIGGGGERVTIPLVAEFADACNFFGAPATVRRKISLLERACEDRGRNPAEITKTWLGHVVVADSERLADDALDRLGQLFGQSPRAARAFALCGTEPEVVAQHQAYLDAGVDGVILTLLDHGDVEHVRRVGALLSPS